MKKINYLVAVIVLSFQISCSSSDSADSTLPPDAGDGVEPSEWLIPKNEVRDGGPGKDGIPSVDKPNFVSGTSADANYLDDNQLVLGIKNGSETRAYPHLILDWHEIINDDFGDISVAVTYCPLTGSGIGWNRLVNGSKTTFGVSGLLYNTNLIPYDRRTGSNWSQIGLKCVNGVLIGIEPDIVQVVETTWGTWKNMFPFTKVVSLQTGFNRNYGVYPYGSYKTNHQYFIFPINPLDQRIPAKERVHAIIDGGNAKAYQFTPFTSGNAIRDTFSEKELLIVGNQDFIVSFELDAATSALTFQYSYANSEAVFSDDQGNEWNILGEAISGPLQGSKLKPTNSFIAYWFSIPAFYDTVLY